MKSSKQVYRFLPMLVALVLCLLTSVSCGNDDPDYFVGYYMNIDSQVRLRLDEEDESQGTVSDGSFDVLSRTIRKMRAALREAYPEKTRQGADGVVLTAVDNVYRGYSLSYSSLERQTVCVVKLCRARMDGDIVIESTTLKTYHFGALDNDNPEDDM